jgi:photosystem II stability/assembly factor-like uncharacterized protein
MGITLQPRIHSLRRLLFRNVTALVFLLVGVSNTNAQGNWITQDLGTAVPGSFIHHPITKGLAVTYESSGPPLFSPAGTSFAWREDQPGHWRLLASPATGDPDQVQLFDAISPSKLITSKGEQIYISNDSGKSWTFASSGANALALNMFSSDSGYKVVGNYEDSSVSLLLTYGDVLLFIDRIGGVTMPFRSQMPVNARTLGRDTIMLLSRQLYSVSTDLGKTWTSVNPFENTNSLKPPFAREVSLTSDPSRFYIVGGYFQESDYLKTTDFGSSWKLCDAGFRGKMARLVESSEQVLFGLVMDTTLFIRNTNLFPGFTGPTGFKKAEGDTLVYTTDGGASWHVEQRFVGDTISHLIAGDSGRVYVMHYRNGHTYISTFTPGASSVDVISSKHSTLKVYPNPSSNSIKFTLPVDGNVHVRFVNVLGQPLYDVDLQHDASRESVIEYPESMRAISGPILMVVETPWYRIGQLVIKQ